MKKFVLFIGILYLVSFFCTAQEQLWTKMEHPITGSMPDDSYPIRQISIDSESNMYCLVRKKVQPSYSPEGLFVCKLSEGNSVWRRIALFDQKDISLLPCQDGRVYVIKQEPGSNPQLLVSADAGESWEQIYQSGGENIVSCFRSSSGKSFIVTAKQILESGVNNYEFSPLFSTNNIITLASLDEDSDSKRICIGLRYAYQYQPGDPLPEEVSQLFSFENGSLLDITGILKQTPIRQLLLNEKGELICINSSLYNMGGSMWVRRAEGNRESVQAFNPCIPEYASLIDGNRLAVSTFGEEVGIDGRSHLALTDASEFAPTWQTDSEYSNMFVHGQSFDPKGKHLYIFGTRFGGEDNGDCLLKSIVPIVNSMLDSYEESSDLAIHVEGMNLKIDSNSSLSRLMIFGMDGQLLLQENLNGSLHEEVYLGDLSRGVYLVQVTRSSGRFYTKKIIF